MSHPNAESQQFSSLAEKNKKSALKWRSLTDEEKNKYCTEATAQNCGDVAVDSKKEADKIIRHLADTVKSDSFDAVKVSLFCRGNMRTS